MNEERKIFDEVVLEKWGAPCAEHTIEYLWEGFLLARELSPSQEVRLKSYYNVTTLRKVVQLQDHQIEKLQRRVQELESLVNIPYIHVRTRAREG